MRPFLPSFYESKHSHCRLWDNDIELLWVISIALLLCAAVVPKLKETERKRDDDGRTTWFPLQFKGIFCLGLTDGSQNLKPLKLKL